MTRYLRTHELTLTFIVTLVIGLLLLVASAFTVSCTLGLLVAGVCFVAAGHWVTYLRTVRA